MLQQYSTWKYFFFVVGDAHTHSCMASVMLRIFLFLADDVASVIPRVVVPLRST